MVLHETYEIICETLSRLHPGSPPTGNVCREADRFAVVVLMQPGPFAAYARQPASTWSSCRSGTAARCFGYAPAG